MGAKPLRDVPHEAWNMEGTDTKRDASFKLYAAAIVLAIIGLVGYLALD